MLSFGLRDFYFYRPELFGSRDDFDWELLDLADHAEFRAGAGWRIWLLDNQDAFRYYRLDLPLGKYRGSEDYFRSVAELAIFE